MPLKKKNRKKEVSMADIVPEYDKVIKVINNLPDYQKTYLKVFKNSEVLLLALAIIMGWEAVKGKR
ncbi:MAG: hypothetical protein II972_01800 [Elusimicrobiaceae bacterium]|nr:hypothetical protein [Elusimicrobiaceae bacterium]